MRSPIRKCAPAAVAMVVATMLACTPTAAKERAAAPEGTVDGWSETGAAGSDASAAESRDGSGYYQTDTVLQEAEAFFGKGAEGLANTVAKAFSDLGEPNAYIKGEEAGGAIGIGVRYGHGTIYFKSGATRKVYWQGPSLGFDIGGNASKAFILVYNGRNEDTLFQRYPGIDGSAYFVGGVGLNYNQSGDTVLAPIRFGVGLRLGASIGYMHLTKEKKLLPF